MEEQMTADAWNQAAPGVAVDTAQLDALCKKMQSDWDAYEKLHNEAKALKEIYEETEHKVLQTLKAAKKSKYHVDGLGTVSIRNTYQVTTPKTMAAKEKLFKYLANRGKEVYYAYLTVNSQSLNSFYNKELELAKEAGAGNFSIPGIDEPTHRETIAFRKEK